MEVKWSGECVYMEFIVGIFIILFDGAFAYLFANIAKKKGYPAISWGVLGFIFPLLYLILLLLPDRNINREKTKKENNKKYVNNFFIIIGVAFIFLIILYIGYISNEENEKEDRYKQYIFDCLTSGYLGVKTNNFNDDFEDQKVYIQDLYKLYNEDYFYKYDDFEYEEDGEFTTYYEDNIDELKDDYIIIVKVEKEEDNETGGVYWETFYYDKYSVKQELVDYIMNYAIERYEKKVTNNYENDVKSEELKISSLYNEGCFSNYFNKLYENNKKEFKDSYVKIEAKGGKIYEKQFFEQ